MLKGINSKVSADLLGILASMGHGDELVICDRNFPGISNATRIVNYRAYRCCYRSKFSSGASTL